MKNYPFYPSEKILEMICKDKDEKPIPQFTYFPTDLSDKAEDTLTCSFLAGITSQLEESYCLYNPDNKYTKEINREKLLLVNEALKNSLNHHFITTKPVILGLFIGELGACYGFKDPGNFFKSKEIKKIFESKIEIKENQLVSHKQESIGLGVNCYIYPSSDLIEVDTKKGVLYCVQLLKTLYSEQI